MRIKDVVKGAVKKIVLATGISLAIPGSAKAINISDIFNIFRDPVGASTELWNQYTGAEQDTSHIVQDTSYPATASTQGRGGNFAYLFTQKQDEINKMKAEWEAKIAEIEAKNQGVQKPTKLANRDEVNAKISALNAEVNREVLDIVLPAWNLSPQTRASLQAMYGTGLKDYQYKQLLFWDEYNYAKMKAGEICNSLGIEYNEKDANEFAVAHASMATLGYGIGRPNMNTAVDMAVATMTANVDPSQWTLTLVMEYLPPGIQTPRGDVNLTYPKAIIAKVYDLYGIEYVDYGSQVGKQPTVGNQKQPTEAKVQPGQGNEKEAPQPAEPQTQDSVQVALLNRINSAIKTEETSKEKEYNNKVSYYDPIIAYGQMLYAIKNPSTIDAILLEANGAGLIRYYNTENGGWEAFLSPGAESILKENGYKDKGNWGKNIENLNKKLQKMAKHRNESGKNFDKDLAKALIDAGTYLVPQGEYLAGLPTDTLRTQLSRYISNQIEAEKEINSKYDPEISNLTKLRDLVNDWYAETDSSKKQEILEEIGRLESKMNVKLDPSVYGVLSGGKKYEPKQKNVQKEEEVPSASEVLGEQGIPGYGNQPNIPETQEPEINPSDSSNYIGSFVIGVGGSEITADSVANIAFQASNLDYKITVGAYLKTLPVSEHTVVDSEGVEYKATILNEREIEAVLKELAEEINDGEIKRINKNTIKDAVKKATGLDAVSKNDGELQSWKTAFPARPGRGWLCNGKQKRWRA